MLSSGSPVRTSITGLFFLLFLPFIVFAQNELRTASIEITPSDLSMQVDEELSLQATVRDERGNATQDTVIFYSRARKSVSVTPAGEVKALKPGSYQIVAVAANRDPQLTKIIPVDVAYPPLKGITLNGLPAAIYAETTLPLEYTVTDAKGLTREKVEVEFSSSDQSVATVNSFGTAPHPETGYHHSHSNDRIDNKQFGDYRPGKPGCQYKSYDRCFRSSYW
ncbi:MAG: Ig-like domain-containing protein [Balneolaceae bacterium]|nr:Ig-like domain-containing protein [Balneolaceae bacterium]